MPNSYKFFKTEIRQWFIDNIPTGSSILDVGPGEGTYADLLKGLGYKIDAIEIHKPYIERFYLKAKYDNVYNENIMHFNYLGVYDFVILGDVLEHLDKNSAQHLLHRIEELNIGCMVAVPYMMAQDGEEYGNIHETHLQPDLTIENMLERYPSLELIYGNNFYGYYKLKSKKHEKAYVLYCTESYADTAQACVNSIKQWSEIPIYVYVVGSSNVDINGATTIIWDAKEYNTVKGKYINRKDTHVYNIMLKRPRVVLDCLENYANTVAYIDCDSVATKYVDRIFDLYPYNATHPYFVKGVYDYMLLDGKGGVDSREDMTGSLEHEACMLFCVDQRVRQGYRQTGYFVAGQWSIPFLEEWRNMCSNTEVLKHPTKYAPYHEETLANVLLWKYEIVTGLPNIYVNGSLDTIDVVKEKGYNITVGEWVKIPQSEDLLLFYHGEKNPEVMASMSAKLKNQLTVLFIAPHLSTGGMPQFLLKRIECLRDLVNIVVVEYQNYSGDYVVQKNKIRNLVPHFYTLEENKMELMDIVKRHKVDVIHVEEMIEGFDDNNRVPKELIDALYSPNRTWRIVETCHNVRFKPDVEKIVHPDAYAFCTLFHTQTFKNMPSVGRVIQYPIEKIDDISKEEAIEKLNLDPNKKHVVNIGLWTPGKNQKEAVELARQMPDVQFHFVGNHAPNFRDYWQPIFLDLPENCLIWGEREDTLVFMRAADVFMFNSVWECNPLVVREAISCGAKILARNLPQYMGMFDPYIVPIGDDLKQQLSDLLESNASYGIPVGEIEQFTKDHIELYKHVCTLPPSKQRVTIEHHFVKGPFVEIKGLSDSVYTVCFHDEQDKLIYKTNLKVNHWARVNRQWFTNWTIRVWEGDVVITELHYNAENKRVYIASDSSSLGDTIAWVPYCLEFKKKHNCHVIVSTFHNYLFEEVYPELEFVKPGTTVDNIYAQYNLGWHYDSNREPVLPNTIPLQKAATNILGLEYKEIKPRVAIKVHTKPEKKYVTIATNSTAGCKFWTKEGWQEVINYLVENDFEVINVSKERNPFDNCTQLEDTSIDNTISHIYYSEFFIGLSSGLSWLAWALDKQVVMISNFTEKDHEFECIRITDESLCHGCWNKAEFKFDKGDWDWCPLHKNTPRHFECHRGIPASKVIGLLPIQPLL